MGTPENIQAGPAELTADAAEVASGGLRVIEVGLIGFAGLVVSPPLFVMVVAVVVPTAVIAAIVGMIAAPIFLVRRVLQHYRDHGRTVFLHRIVP